MNQYRKSFGRWKRLLKPSVAEKRFLAVMGWRWRIRYRPRREYPVKGYYIDFALVRQKVAIEIDGAAYHDVIGAWEYDRRRDTHLYSAGWATLRIPARDVLYKPERVRYTVQYFMIHGKKPSKYPKYLS